MREREGEKVEREREKVERERLLESKKESFFVFLHCSLVAGLYIIK